MATEKIKKVATPSVGQKATLKDLDPSVGWVDKSGGKHEVKTSGIKIRGTGAATKGTMARGPMA